MFDSGIYSRAPSLGLAGRKARGGWGFLKLRRKSRASRLTHRNETSGGRFLHFDGLRKSKPSISERLTALAVHCSSRGRVHRNSH